MTIYKVIPQDQKQEKKLKKKDALAVPLTPAEGGEVVEQGVTVTLVRRRTKLWVNLFLITLALLVLATGITGGYYLYKKHLSPKVKGNLHFSARITDATPKNEEIDDGGIVSNENKHNKRNKQYEWRCGTFEMQEDIELVNQNVERIKMPRFQDILDSLILHDFERNYSAIVDYNDDRCYIMKLNRSEVTPPKNLIDLFRKINSGYYLPKADVLLKRYRVMTPALQNIDFLGPYIYRECIFYSTYRLISMTGTGAGRMVKRSAVPKKRIFGYYDDKPKMLIRYEIMK